MAAWVEGGGLPFVSQSGAGVPYLLPTLTGPVSLEAYAPGPPPVVGAASGDVVAGGPETATVVPVVLEGAVTPPDGALGVPVTTFVELEASAPLQEEADFSTKVWLENPGGEVVPVRYLLSGSRTRLSVIPLQSLESSTTYRVVVAGLLDTYGVPVQVAETDFTTKDFDKRTGLGLSIAYNIIQHHGGTIRVDSDPGRGTTFVISIPITETSPSAPSSPMPVNTMPMVWRPMNCANE